MDEKVKNRWTCYVWVCAWTNLPLNTVDYSVLFPPLPCIPCTWMDFLSYSVTQITPTLIYTNKIVNRDKTEPVNRLKRLSGTVNWFHFWHLFWLFSESFYALRQVEKVKWNAVRTHNSKCNSFEMRKPFELTPAEVGLLGTMAYDFTSYLAIRTIPLTNTNYGWPLGMNTTEALPDRSRFLFSMEEGDLKLVRTWFLPVWRGFKTVICSLTNYIRRFIIHTFAVFLLLEWLFRCDTTTRVAVRSLNRQID